MGGVITGTSPSTAIVAGVTSLIYEKQSIEGEELANTNIMKTILSDYVEREPTISYPNPSRGYGVINVNFDLF